MPLDNYNIEITNDDIIDAEKILLSEWEHFDDERKDFIKNLDTIDLQAVPWSGKTTAILPKLIILERKMPFSNWSGILVLSHTNTAVDEIKNRLLKIAPKLFQFPNFIWTIQSFVDEFLTKPYLVWKWMNIDFIDSERQKQLLNSSIYLYYNWINQGNKTKLNYIKNADPKKILDSNLFFIDWNIKIYLDWKEININKPRWNTNPRNYIDYTEIEKLDVYNALIKLKLNLIKSWKLSYEDAYFLWFKYLDQFPKIIKILQKRFHFVFVDEMQDMEKHQVDILEKIFYDEDNDKYCFQRIGDKNQAIYNWWDVKIDSEWKWWDRKELQIVWTHRLTQSVANVAKNFWIDFIPFDWQRKLKDSSWCNLEDIKPILLVYKTEHLNNDNPECKENQILKKFTEIISEKKWEWYFSDVKEDKFICKAVIWNAKAQEWWFNREQCRAKHYFFDYDVEWWKSKNKPWLKTEKDYLFYYDKLDTTYKSKNHNIWRLLLRILRENDIKNPETWKIFSRKDSLLEFFKRNHYERSLELKSKIYDWTKRLNDTNIDEIAKEMDEYYFEDLLVYIFWKTLEKTILNSTLTSNIGTIWDIKELNVFIDEIYWTKVDIWNVHSIKWETHTCTLYLESCYNPPSRWEDRINKWYESIRLKKIFLWNIFSDLTKTYDIQSSKMLYVWLSRPTHLLCYAIHEERYNQLKEIDETQLNTLWEIKSV